MEEADRPMDNATALPVPELGTASPAGPIRLSAREAAVLRAFAAGQKGPETARALRMSYRTLKRTTADLQERLAAPSMFVLGMRAVELGLLSRDESCPPDDVPAAGAAEP